MVDLIVLGLDGLDSGLVKKEIASGSMSKTLELVQSGQMDMAAIDSYKLDHWEYPWTGNAWPTIYCGEDEQYHGVDVPGWQEGAVSFTGDVPDTVFDDISHAGLTVGSFRMAITYPARPVLGWMIGGFPGGGKEEIKENELYGLEPDQIPDGYLAVKDKKVSGETDSAVSIAKAESRKVNIFDEIVANSGHDEDVLFYGTQMTDKAAHRFHLKKNGRGEGDYDYWKSSVGTMTCTKSDDIIEHMIEKYDPDRLVAISDHGIMRWEDNHSMRAMVMEYCKDGEIDLSEMESILDFRTHIQKLLGIPRRRETFKESDAEMTDEEREQVTERLEDMGYL